MSTRIRTIRVYNAINKLGRGSLEEIVSVVEQDTVEETSVDSLKRTVRRDLNMLVSEHAIGVKYYTPAGDEIHPDEEDEHKNRRAIYYVLQDSASRWSNPDLLRKNKIKVFGKEALSEAIHFYEDLEKIPSGSICISFNSEQSTFVHMWISPDDLPLNIQFSRNSPEINRQAESEIEESLGRRSLLVLLENKSVSRFNLENQEGQVRIKFFNGNSPVVIANQFEKGRLAYQKVESFEEIRSYLEISNETTSIYTKEFKWKELKDFVEIPMDCMIRAGDVFIVAHKKA